MAGWFRKKDLILCGVLLVAGIICWLVMRLVLPTGNTADVYIDDKLVQTIDMTVDDTYEFNTDRGSNTVVVESGKISVDDADCPDKVCVNMGWKRERRDYNLSSAQACHRDTRWQGKRYRCAVEIKMIRKVQRRRWIECMAGVQKGSHTQVCSWP